MKYCAALANEGGGRIVLGVTDARPRKVVGTQAFPDLQRTKAGLIERLHLRIDVEELSHPDGRVLVFTAPSRPIGMPVQFEGAYWMRSGEALKPMTPDALKRIFDESHPDFSAEVCAKATIEHLAPEAIETFRRMWIERSGNRALDRLEHEQLLRDAELLTDDGLTYAALILFGTRRALGKFLAQSEVIFEYRSDEASISYQQREEYRQGFFLFRDELWNKIDLRNDLHHYQDGMVMRQIPTFNESVVREAVLNAVSHREYRLAGSVFVRQLPRKVEIVSPGGSRLAWTLRASSGSSHPGIGGSPRLSPDAAWWSGRARARTGCSSRPSGRASRCPTSPGRMITACALRYRAKSWPPCSSSS